MKNKNWKKYALEFLSIFIAVISAFALNNWNDNRRDERAESKILLEIKNGLEKDIEDLDVNTFGHKEGIEACNFFRAIIDGNEESQDSLFHKYVALTRDFTSLQNNSGFETLKSRGFELIDNDSLRSALISLYEYDYEILRKFEEEYVETQFHSTYFHGINNIIAPFFIFNEGGIMVNIETPLKLNEEERKLLLSYLLKIQANRGMNLFFYEKTKKKVLELKEKIEDELASSS